VQTQLDLIIKLIYFEDEGFLPVDIRDLVEALESQAGRGMPSGMLGGIESLLLGGGLESIMKMLEGTELS